VFIYLCVGGIDFASFYDFCIGIWNCSDNVVFFVFHFIAQKTTRLNVIMMLNLYSLIH